MMEGWASASVQVSPSPPRPLLRVAVSNMGLDRSLSNMDLDRSPLPAPPLVLPPLSELKMNSIGLEAPIAAAAASAADEVPVSNTAASLPMPVLAPNPSPNLGPPAADPTLPPDPSVAPPGGAEDDAAPPDFEFDVN